MTESDHDRGDRALRRARGWALVNLTIPALWLCLGALLAQYGYPWTSRQYAIVPYPILAAVGAAGLGCGCLGGFLIDRHRAARSPAIGRGFMLAAVGGVVAGMAALAMLVPAVIEPLAEQNALPSLTGSRSLDGAIGAALAGVPLLLGAANGLAWVRNRSALETL